MSVAFSWRRRMIDCMDLIEKSKYAPVFVISSVVAFFNFGTGLRGLYSFVAAAAPNFPLLFLSSFLIISPVIVGLYIRHALRLEAWQGKVQAVQNELAKLKGSKNSDKKAWAKFRTIEQEVKSFPDKRPKFFDFLGSK